MRRSAFLAVLAACNLLACAPFTGPKPQVTQVAILPGTILLDVTVEKRNARAMLLQRAVNQDVETWQSGDGTTSVSLLGGIVVSTRGLGFDVMGSDMQQTINAVNGQVTSAYSVRRRYLTGDNQSRTVVATCSMNRSVATRYVETCVADGVSYANEYRRDSAGRLVGSRQWIGPELGYLNLSFIAATA